MAVRLIRKSRLTDEERPLELVAVVYEAALHREIGGRAVMRDQLRHLLEMSALPTVTLQLIPLGEGTHYVPNATFILLGFLDPDDPELLYIEHPMGSLHIEDSAQVRTAIVMFDRLRTNALNPADSAALIERLATERYGP